MAHTHACITCGKHYECTAPLERNFDGWPEVVCVSRMEPNPIFQQCPKCNGMDDDEGEDA